MDAAPGVEMRWLMDYMTKLTEHIYNVQMAGGWIDVERDRLEYHDMTKLSLAEFPHYARQFCGDRGDPAGFARAWLHHQNHNDHHWEYWIMRSGGANPDSCVIANCYRMPQEALREMVADWLGASKSYTGLWSIRNWFEKHRNVITIHPQTRLDLMELLEQISFGEVFDV